MNRLLFVILVVLLLNRAALADSGLISVTGSITNANDVVSLGLRGESSCSVDLQWQGGGSGTITFEGALESTSPTWFPVFGTAVGNIFPFQNVASSGQYAASCAGFQGFRIRLSSVGSGTATVTLTASPGLSPVPVPVTLQYTVPDTFSFFTMLSQTTNQVIVTGAGTYYGMASISTAAQTQSTTCWDNTTNSGTILGATILAAGAQQVYSNRGIHFSTGLTCKNAAALTGNGILVFYTSP